MRRPSRLVSLVVPVVALIFAACSDQPSAPPEQVPEPAPSIESYRTPCSTSDIRTLVKSIFPGPLGTLLTIKINLFIRLSAHAPGPRVQARFMEIISDLLAARRSGEIGNDPEKLRKVESLIKLLYCILGEEAPPLDLVNGDAVVVTPTTGAIVAAHDPANPGLVDAATEVKVGDVPDNVPAVLVSVVRITTPNPLDTPLQQRGAFYEFTTTPRIRFDTPVLVGVCLDKANDASDQRLRLAHNLSPSRPVTPGNIRFGNIEIISPESELGPLNLGCEPLTVGFFQRAVDWLLPERLYAAGTGTGGRGGKVSEYSPFGGVVPEPLDFGQTNWLFTQPSTGNPSIPATVQGGQPVPFFAEGGATTPVNGIIAQGPWTFGSAPIGETRDANGSFASQCNGAGNTVNYDLGTASVWNRASAGVTTNPAEFTYLLARKVFYAGNAGDRISLALDNDIRTWVNGQEVTSYEVDGHSVTVSPGNFLEKEGCAGLHQVFVTLPRSGINVIAVQARDRGVASYFDAGLSAP